MKLLPALIAAAAALMSAATMPAHALTFSESAAPSGLTFGAPVVTTAASSLAYTTTGDISGIQLAPQGVTGDYLAILNGGSADLALDHAGSYSFLWGSPDTYNLLTITTTAGVVQYSGSTLLAAIGNGGGTNDDTRWFTMTAAPGESITDVRFSSSGNSFELAAAVPEPATYAMLLGGLAAVGAVVRRRRA